MEDNASEFIAITSRQGCFVDSVAGRGNSIKPLNRSQNSWRAIAWLAQRAASTMPMADNATVTIVSATGEPHPFSKATVAVNQQSVAPSTKPPQEAAWKTRCKVLGHLIRRYPHVLIVPLAVLGLLLGLGIWGVQRGKAQSSDNNRQSATWEATSAAQDLQTDFEQALLPQAQLAGLVQSTPNVAAYAKLWDTVVDSWWAAAPPGAIGLTLTAQGVNYRINSCPQCPSPTEGDYTGGDTLGLGSQFRPAVLGSISFLNAPSLQGPFPLPGIGGKAAVGFLKNIWIANVTANETWGTDREATACPEGLCYNKATRTKWWGQVIMTVVVDTLLGENPFLKSLINKGYSYHLSRPGNSWAGEGDEMPVLSSGNTSAAPAHAVRKKVQAVDRQWELAVWKGDDWEDDLNYLYAVVVIGSVVISVLLFAVLLGWVENRALLHSLLPKQTIERMRAEAPWVQSPDEHFKAIQLETPAQGLLSIINTCVDGGLPALPRLLAMRDVLQRSVDVYRPSANTVKECMQQLHVDAEVRDALVAQLVDAYPDSRGSGGLADPTPADAAGAEALAKGLETRKSAQLQYLRQLSAKGQCGLEPCSPTKGPNIPTKVSGSSDASPGKGTSPKADAEDSIAILTDSTLDPFAATMLQLLQPPSPSGHLLPLEWSDGQPALSPKQNLPSPGALSPHHNLPSPARLRVTADGRNEGAARLRVTIDGNSEEAGQTARVAAHRLLEGKPMAGLLTEVEAMLVTADSWEFDAYAFEVATCGHPLSVMGYWLLQSTGLITWANMDTGKLVRFLQHIEGGYSSANPYHNKRHAADVLQSVHVIIHRGGLMGGYVDQTTMLACYLAAVVHDYEHKGRNNDFLVNAHDDLAVRYNDRSPMENHHLAAAFAVLKRPEFDCLSCLPKATWSKVRKLMIDLVLSTDMKQHFATLGHFDTLRSTLLVDRVSKRSLATPSDSPNGSASAMRSAPKPVSETDRLLALQLALKCADLGHLTAPLHVHLRWVKDLEEEFFLQGDAEKAAGLTVSPLCNRSKEGVYKSQVGFFEFVACPLFKAFTGHFPKTVPLVKALATNQRYWQNLANQKQVE